MATPQEIAYVAGRDYAEGIECGTGEVPPVLDTLPVYTPGWDGSNEGEFTRGYNEFRARSLEIMAGGE